MNFIKKIKICVKQYSLALPPVRKKLSYEGEGINSPYQLLQFVCKNGMCDKNSNFTVALTIILILPLTVASGDCRF